MTKLIHISFGFRNGELVTVIYSLFPETETAIDCDYYITDPQDAEKQITEWKNAEVNK